MPATAQGSGVGDDVQLGLGNLGSQRSSPPYQAETDGAHLHVSPTFGMKRPDHRDQAAAPASLSGCCVL